MKRFMLFVAGDYYPGGGMYDFHASFETAEDARKEFTPRADVTAHIYDLEVGRIVDEWVSSGWGPVRAPGWFSEQPKDVQDEIKHFRFKSWMDG